MDPIVGNELEVVMELLFCIKAMMNNLSSMNIFIKIPQSLDTIAYCLRLGIEEVTILCLELLTAAAFFSMEGQELVLKAMEAFRQMSREYSRFTTLVYMLKHANSMDLKISVLLFVNYLVNCEELDQRIKVRNDFLHLNLVGVCRKIIDQGDVPRKFLTQVEVFEQLSLEDASIINYDGVCKYVYSKIVFFKISVYFISFTISSVIYDVYISL